MADGAGTFDKVLGIAGRHIDSLALTHLHLRTHWHRQKQGSRRNSDQS
jgi:hypothetical protein